MTKDYAFFCRLSDMYNIPNAFELDEEAQSANELYLMLEPIQQRLKPDAFVVLSSLLMGSSLFIADKYHPRLIQKVKLSLFAFATMHGFSDVRIYTRHVESAYALENYKVEIKNEFADKVFVDMTDPKWFSIHFEPLISRSRIKPVESGWSLQ